jgi:hypothetical protein
LEGKIVYLNCDDPRYSNFFRYFVDNFSKLKIKSVIASGYAINGKNDELGNSLNSGIWAEYNGISEDNLSNLTGGISLNFFNGDGDFRSKESLELLERADVIITNPPFSLFREYVSQVIENKKNF